MKYYDNELRNYQKECEEIRQTSTKEEQDQLSDHMTNDQGLIACRIVWLLQGCYGYASQHYAKQIANNKRYNQPARLTQMIGLLEWRVAERNTCKIWKTLTQDQKDNLDRLIKIEIQDYLEDQKQIEKGDQK